MYNVRKCCSSALSIQTKWDPVLLLHLQQSRYQGKTTCQLSAFIHFLYVVTRLQSESTEMQVGKSGLFH